MKIKEVLELDFRVKDDKKKLGKELKKIKSLQNKKITVEDLENVLLKLSKKYKIKMNYINLIIRNNNIRYSAFVVLGKKEIYFEAISLKEMLAKIIIIHLIKKGELEKICF
jgi:hypothetical protein